MVWLVALTRTTTTTLLTVQCATRVFLSKCQMFKLKQKQHALHIASATTLQSCYRRHMAMQKLASTMKACVQIPAMVRMSHAVHACCPSLPKQLVICRFLRFHRGRHHCCFNSLFTGTGTGWIESPTEWNLYKRVRARGGGA